MASKTTPSPSRIPIPVRSTTAAPPVYAVQEVLESANINSRRLEAKLHTTVENGVATESPNSGLVSPLGSKGKGFETFLMTGDMIIRTTPPSHHKSRCPDESPSPSPKRKDISDGGAASLSSGSSSPRDRVVALENSPRISAPNKAMTENGASLVAPVPRAPVASFEDFSDMSQSSSSGEFAEGTERRGNGVGPPGSLGLVADTSRLDEALETLGMLGSLLPGSGSNSGDNTLNEAPSSGDSGVLQDSNSSDSDMADASACQRLEDKNDHVQRVMTTSMSEEKIVSDSASHSDTANRPLVRTSKSHENYLQSESGGLSLVAIDIDDMAYSLDTLNYRDSNSDSSNEKVGESQQQVQSLNNTPERKGTDCSGTSSGGGGGGSDTEREFVPSFISLESDPRHKPKLKDIGRGEEIDEEMDTFPGYGDDRGPGSERVSPNGYGDREGDIMQLSIRSDDSDADSLYHQPSKAVDQPSACRLAKRLYHLEGFRKSDVSRHLSKKNDFSNLVAEEYLKFFDFREDSLDQSLRKFLQQFCLTGETQERERVLAHFSRHYMECNKGAFNSEDACHTLTCAIMLLNTDLHGQNMGRKMTCADFIENLSDLNDGENFPKEVLRIIYTSIKSEPIEWAVDDSVLEGEGTAEEGVAGSTAPPVTSVPSHAGSNPFLELPDPSKTTEYKKGYVMRKSVMEPGKRKTPFGKRGWRMVYAVLKDLVLYQYKDEHQVKKGQFVESANNVVRIHHALATKATDYTKKQHVFRLQTADWAEYLFQTGGSAELQEWIDTINLVAASLSAPPLPSGVGSQSRFQRPLMPSSCTKHSIPEQLLCHGQHIAELEQELQLHRAAAPEKGSKSTTISNYLEKESYLENELKRFKTYVYLLQAKVMAPIEMGEASLVETAIGEDDESSLHGSPVSSGQGAFLGPASFAAVAAPSAGPRLPVSKQPQRSLSDRYSYRAAIYNTERVEYDII